MSTLGWGPALCFSLAGFVFVSILWVAATDPIRKEKRQIKRYRKQRRKIRATWKELNALKPGAFQIKRYSDWSTR